jgi:trk system potassium uptake protein TrkH
MSRRAEINYKLILRVIGFLLIIEAAFMFTGLPFSWIYGGFKDMSLLYSGIITAVIGFILYFGLSRRKVQSNIGKREGYLIVTFTWIIISIFGTLPFMFSGVISNFTDAFFETMSGFTTTGATILTDIEVVPKGILYWRSLTHWIGGMGIIVLSVAILPVLGIGGMQLFVAEMPGPAPDKLHPRITHTAKRLWGIYVLLTFVETIMLMTGGMNFFDSLCHAFGTMATGGFSTQNDSIAGYSPYIQYIIIAFMILAGTNFTLHYYALLGKFGKFWRNEEFKYYMGIIFITSLIISVSVIIIANSEIESTVRDSIFQVVSIVTTTGFITSDYLLWPRMLWLLLFLLMFIGGSAGSTGGGIKIIRQLLLIKNSGLELKRLVHPQAVIPVKFNRKSVPRDIIFKIMAFFLIYMVIFAFGSLVMSIVGLDFESAIGSTAATLGNIGPGLGMVGPVGNYAEIPIIGKWFLSFFMLLGRLELFTVLIIFSPSFWRK